MIIYPNHQKKNIFKKVWVTSFCFFTVDISGPGVILIDRMIICFQLDSVTHPLPQHSTPCIQPTDTLNKSILNPLPTIRIANVVVCRNSLRVCSQRENMERGRYWGVGVPGANNNLNLFSRVERSLPNVATLEYSQQKIRMSQRCMCVSVWVALISFPLFSLFYFSPFIFWE